MADLLLRSVVVLVVLTKTCGTVLLNRSSSTGLRQNNYNYYLLLLNIAGRYWYVKPIFLKSLMYLKFEAFWHFV